mgnify:CR=1 FL=1
MTDLDKLILTKLKKFRKLCKHQRSSDGQWYFKDPSPKTIQKVKSDGLLMALFTDSLKDSLARNRQCLDSENDFSFFAIIREARRVTLRRSVTTIKSKRKNPLVILH